MANPNHYYYVFYYSSHQLSQPRFAVHAYLLPSVFESPIRDLQVQWKSCGTLVGSFNFMMYGSLTYVGEKMSGDNGAEPETYKRICPGIGLPASTASRRRSYIVGTPKKSVPLSWSSVLSTWSAR